MRRLPAEVCLVVLSACGDASDPMDHCAEAHSDEMTQTTGEFRVEMRHKSAVAPEDPFQGYIQTFPDGSFELAACQVNDYGQLWHFRTGWHGVPDELTEPLEASFRPDSAPIFVDGWMGYCEDASCADQVRVLGFIPLMPSALWLDSYSRADGAVRGSILQTVAPPSGATSLVQVYFDLHWEVDSP